MSSADISCTCSLVPVSEQQAGGYSGHVAQMSLSSHSIIFGLCVFYLRIKKISYFYFFCSFVEQNQEFGSPSCCFNCVALTKLVSLCLYILSDAMGITIAPTLWRVGRGK